MVVRAYDDATGLQRLLRRIGASTPGSWVLRRTLHHVDGFVHRVSGHRVTLAQSVVGIPTAMLTTTGARTGRTRTVPVLAFDVTGGWGLVASSFGQERHPGWYYNLLAHPDAALGLAALPRVRRLRATGQPPRAGLLRASSWSRATWSLWNPPTGELTAWMDSIEAVESAGWELRATSTGVAGRQLQRPPVVQQARVRHATGPPLTEPFADGEREPTWLKGGNRAAYRGVAQIATRTDRRKPRGTDR